MRLASFIRTQMPSIIEEWQNFAATLIPAAEGMSPLSLRNHIKQILLFIAADMESKQTELEQVEKSRGEKPKMATPSGAEIHASLRYAGGFNMDQMVSEYRALRASVIKLWMAPLTPVSRSDILDLIRFNEGVDQALSESISHYTKKIEHSRNLFLGILSHDLRSPLGAAHMSAKLTLNIGPLNERQTMLVTQVADSTDRATEIVDHLLDLTRARLGSGIPIIKEPMDMGFVARQLVDEMRAMHPDRKFTLEISGDMNGAWDKPRMGQIFSNLLGNAVQYGFKDLPINVTLEGTARRVVLSVHNQGVPIAPNKIGRIFDSLTRGNGTEDDENGTGSVNLGLGLYIVKEIVIAHGGTVGVTSTEKTGTTFTVTLPKAASPTAKPIPRPKKQRAQVMNLVKAK